MDINELIDNGHKDRKYTKDEGLIIFEKILEHKNTLYKGEITKSNGEKAERCINWKSCATDIPQKKFFEIFAEYLNDNNIYEYEKVVDNTNYNGRDSRKELHSKEIDSFNNYKEYWETPSIGEKGKPKRMDEDKMCHCLFHATNISGFECVDYQIPLVDGDANNIDFMMSKDGILYMCEVKKIKSSETLLRCILEIATYYQQLNLKSFEMVYGGYSKIQKTILVPINSEAYKEYKKIDKYPNLKKLMDRLDIIVFGLAYNEETNKFDIVEK